jgi:hypothetical protein
MQAQTGSAARANLATAVSRDLRIVGHDLRFLAHQLRIAIARLAPEDRMICASR